MLLSKNSLMRWIHWPILLSICLHISIATALFHAIEPGKQAEVTPMSVAMIQLAAEETPVSKPAVSESLPEPEPEPEPVAEIALPKPEKKKIVKKEVKPREKKTEKASEQPLKPISDQETQTAKNLDDQKSEHHTISEKAGVHRGPKALNRPDPIYPSRALQLGTEGKVKVKFDIDENGRVKNIEIISADPKNVFEREVKNAMRKWRYEKIPAIGHITTIEFKTTGISQS
ncbi:MULTISPECIES: TonB system transport protein TonB [Xenorhabdus]|uniref:Protein TonB n=1 Tax=Xenorhabdus ehlersii TaxID=290111 RepID=A0A2D0IQS7_9GAMM|nr:MULTISPECIES: TonB system transport protein TonB [Xenorhabdus]MBC8950797.1 membrane spanning protein TonB [Xenorhabdus sp. TS4]PHM24196.1 membrane spanning protein TonB [Xenorhabdus ehlersii]RKE91114.1 outer membrane transport energization protein TonB [Xenorhabdus ehlersii]